MKKILPYVLTGLLTLGGLSSCQDFFELESEQVLFVDDLKLNTVNDTVYSVIGIINRLQQVADKTVLLGEIRSDLISLTDKADLELQALATFTAGTNNLYNRPQDYYAIINNCNYFIANADTALRKRNEPVFLKEYAAVKAFRAWTYLQLAKIYGSVPFVIEPIEKEKQTNIALYEKKDMAALCDFFIEDIKPFINTDLPGYGNIGGLNSTKFFIPVRLLLGDLCLWAGRYMESALYYHDYLTNRNRPMPLETNQIAWRSNTNTFDGNINDSYAGLFTDVSGQEIISYIPMEANRFEGTISELRNIFNSTLDNDYYYQAKPSNAFISLSKQQSNCKIYLNEATQVRDTIYAPSENIFNEFWVGDLRLYSIYRRQYVGNSSLSSYSTDRQTIQKIGRHVPIYRRGTVYLRYAEALNRTGFPSAAFAILKYGLTEENIVKYVDSMEVKIASGTGLLDWDLNLFTATNTMGIHSRGAGVADANKQYVLPAMANKTDSILYVENLISDELALETAFEGQRFYDLMRIALRRNDHAYLANKVAGRDGASNFNQALYNKLMDVSQWYLPLNN